MKTMNEIKAIYNLRHEPTATPSRDDAFEICKQMRERYNKLGDLNSLDKTIATCCFEHRDKGTDWDNCQPTTYRSFAQFMQERNDADYLYIMQDGKWYYHNEQ